jgi:hypothetical protein
MAVKLIIRDEVNIKFENLPLDARKKLVATFKYADPTARHRPAFKLGRWDGTVSLFGLGGNGYISQLEKILEILTNMGIHLDDVDDQRKPVNLQFTPITETYWADQGRVWPPGHPAEGTPIMLRDYQVSAINRFLEHPQSLQEIATGAGKTITTATLSQISERIGRSIIIVPNKSLVEQTEEDFINCGLDVGVYYGDRKDLYKTHTICTWQSLNILDKKSKNSEHDIVTLAEFLDNVNTVIVDECFSGEMKVLTVNGYIPIKDIKSGDKVINYAENNKEFKIDTVIKQHINLTNSTSEKMYELEFDNGSMIAVTGNHKFLTTDGWIRAEELTSNHFIISKT